MYDRAYGLGWSQTDELLAGVAELVDAGNRLLYSIHRRRSDPPVPRPIKIRRPNRDPDEKPRIATPEEVRAFFGARLRRALTG